MTNLFPMTLRGAYKLRKELEELKNNKRPKIIRSIKIAREHGDLKENAEYQAAREEQSFCEGRIQDIEAKLSNAQIIDISKISNVGKIIFGVTITILDVRNKKTFIYQIVGHDESDCKNKLLSIHSPLARGLIGKYVGDIVQINTPKGNIEFEILAVEHI
ncbi:transcription elongation factor GreA [Buchnera aphidicola (Nipponaphis monzeni)]|uniref:Transcription elongation factor GreA n=1 Tax=Buchnera aphidicola (Nipponaphis monzeni) TaxID=2495405 RepID=A0A455TAF7_9GAMM|nr:transcription elongation factor GreA [Buchnera aphidicola]BBI01302.1 transcription elongation factor GreA [Buchnera aphidicola (Nipponaphis monzeni)]